MDTLPIREESAEALAPACRSAYNRCNIFDMNECLHKPEYMLGLKLLQSLRVARDDGFFHAIIMLGS